MAIGEGECDALKHRARRFAGVCGLIQMQELTAHIWVVVRGTLAAKIGQEQRA